MKTDEIQDFEKEIKEPEIEKIISKDDIEGEYEIDPEIEDEIEEKLEESEIKEIDLDLKNNPYHYIRSFYEEMLPFIGSRVWSVLSFLPISLIMPKIMINNRPIRIHINLLWLSPSGYGKSVTAREFSKITYSPLITKKMTTPRLVKELEKNKMTSLIIEDVSVWFMDEEKIKFLEGATGEEETISHETMRNIKKGTNRHVDVISFCSGTAENITNQKVKTGILRRFSPLIIYLSLEEHRKVIEFINKGVGETKEIKSFEPISNFYKELKNIQDGYNKEISPIEGYIIPESIKKEANEFFLPLILNLHKKYRLSMATETEQMWRFCCCHAFLNIFKKKQLGLIQNNQIVIDNHDLEVAKRLIAREISSKSIIMQCIENIDYFNIKTREQLIEWEEKRRKSGKKEIPKEAKFIFSSNVKN